ncbi:sirohydrochlorin chelatase [Bacillus sp. 1P06AnD]|uniref:sirohydrochlorin chelatase n=1 Tax=Bacillus sp. 1P06AnD TaxID=3132208 RepID=UPI00399FDA2D
MESILFIGHGTRSKEGAREAKEFIQKLMEEITDPIKEYAFLELAEPTIEQGFKACIAQGATSIYVVPLFLLAAGHIKEDIPFRLTALMKKHPGTQVFMANPFGVQESILDSIAEEIARAAGNLTGEDAILIVGRGSSDSSLQHHFSQITAGISERTGINNVQACYLAAAKPAFPLAITELNRTTTGRLVVVPYLLFAGLLLSEVFSVVKEMQQTGNQTVVTEPLSRHKSMKDLVVAKVRGKGVQYAALGH